MKLFGRNGSPSAGSGVGQAGEGVPHPPVTHRLTMELSRAQNLAVMLANSRGAAMVEIVDLLAGMYIYDWERLSKYWDYDDQSQMEDMLRRICEISPQRWHHWIQLYDKKRREGDERKSWLTMLPKQKKNGVREKPMARSAALTSLLRAAEELTPFRDKLGGRDTPILTSESVLLCMVRNHGSEISTKLTRSGLNVPKLEASALTTRRGPRDD